MYCIALRNKFDKTIIGWYDASASNFSTDQRRAKHFFDRVDADLVADQLRRMYPRLAQDIEVTAAQPTGLTCRSDAVAGLLCSDRGLPDGRPRRYRLRPPRQAERCSSRMLAFRNDRFAPSGTDGSN